MRPSPLFACLAVFTLIACTPASDTPAPEATADEAAAAAQIEATGAWVRTPAEGRATTAGYLTLRTPDADTLVAASSPQAERIELHTMEMEGEVMRMRRAPDGLPTGPEGLSLAPGGNHLMIFGLSPDALTAGEMTISLTLEGGATIDLIAPISRRAPAAASARE